MREEQRNKSRRDPLLPVSGTCVEGGVTCTSEERKRGSNQNYKAVEAKW